MKKSGVDWRADQVGLREGRPASDYRGLPIRSSQISKDVSLKSAELLGLQIRFSGVSKDRCEINVFEGGCAEN